MSVECEDCLCDDEHLFVYLDEDDSYPVYLCDTCYEDRLLDKDRERGVEEE